MLPLPLQFPFFYYPYLQLGSFVYHPLTVRMCVCVCVPSNIVATHQFDVVNFRENLLFVAFQI